MQSRDWVLSHVTWGSTSYDSMSHIMVCNIITFYRTLTSGQCPKRVQEIVGKRLLTFVGLRILYPMHIPCSAAVGKGYADKSYREYILGLSIYEPTGSTGSKLISFHMKTIGRKKTFSKKSNRKILKQYNNVMYIHCLHKHSHIYI